MTITHLRVSASRRFLERTDGTPFFYLGDTAWELFHRLSVDEARRYFADRAAKGFTVIQAVVLAELDGLIDPNANGDLPLIDRDLTMPNEAYFRHVDALMAEAAAQGLTIGMLPTWGKYFSEQHPDQVITPDNAGAYGRFLGRRYKDAPLIWILGGDYNVANEDEARTVAALAAGLREGDGGAHLITYHPRGPGRSSQWFHTADWLDFNMIQSSHAAHDFDNGVFVEQDYSLEPAKPTLDGEPRYETIPVGFYFTGNNQWDRFTDVDVRQAAYWSLLAGACGHTYGNNTIWQMWQPGRKPRIGAAIPWYEAIHHPGSLQMGFVRRLFESRPFQRLRPAQHMIVDGPPYGGAKVRAACADDGSFAFVYSPYGETVTVDMRRVSGSRIRQSWFDPRYGVGYTIHTGCSDILTFTPPTSGRGNDWLLVLDDAAAGYGAPGNSGQMEG